jgi:hypothetical protein
LRASVKMRRRETPPYVRKSSTSQN